MSFVGDSLYVYTQMLASTVLSVNEEVSAYRCQVHSINSLFSEQGLRVLNISITKDIKIKGTLRPLFSSQVDDLLKRVEYVENDWNVLVGAPRRSFHSSLHIFE